MAVERAFEAMPSSRTLGDIDLTGDAAVPSPVPAAPVVDEVQERLRRVEHLLDADLEALGPAVVASAITAITARVDGLAAAIDAATAAWSASPEVAAVDQRLASIERRLDRLTMLVELATEPLPEPEALPVDPTLLRLEAGLAALTAEVQRMVAIADRVG